MPKQILTTVLLATAAVLTACPSAVLAVDAVQRKSVKAPVSGEVTDVSKTEVTVKPIGSGKEPVKIPANDINSITWTGEPPGLNLARSDETGGRFAKSLEGYQAAVTANKSDSAGLKTDLEYYVARSTAKIALADPAKVDDAIKKMEAFKSKHGDSYNYYEAVHLLGRLYLAKKDLVKAKSAFDELGKAPWKDYQMASKNAVGGLLLADNKPDEARSAFEAVVGMKAENPLEESQRQQAMLGTAKILTMQKKYADAVKLLDEVIEKAAPEDARVQAEAYVRQGDCLEAEGKTKDALLAYLHVDVLFPAEKTLHAESLFHLSRLWAKVGQTDRAAEAKEKLEAEFPNSEWTKQLKSAPAESEKAAAG